MSEKADEIKAIRAIQKARGIGYAQAKAVLGLEVKPQTDEGDIGKAASDVLRTQEQLKRSRNLPSDLDPMSAAGRAAYWNASFGAGGASPYSRSAKERAAVEEARLGRPGTTGVANAVNDLRMDEVAGKTGGSYLTDAQRAEAQRIRAYGYSERFAAPATTQGTVLGRPRPWESGTPTGASRMPVAGGGIDLVGQAKDPVTGKWGGNNILATSRPVAAAGDGKTVAPGTYSFNPGATVFTPNGAPAPVALPSGVITPTAKKNKTLPDELPKPPSNLLLAEFREQHGSEFDPKSSLDRSKMAILKPRQKKKVEVAAL